MSQALPDRWCAARLAELASVQLGKMLSAKAKTGRGARPYLRNVNVRWHRIDVGDVFEMDFDAREVEKYQLLSGDVLVCEGGEPGRAAVWSNQLPGALYQKALHRVRFTRECVEPRYFTYFLELAAAEGLLAKRFTGSTIKHLPREAFLEVPIPVAPTAEQRRIVAALEEHLSELDAAVAGLERARANARRIRQSVRDVALSAYPTRRISELLAEPLSNGRSVPTADAGFPVLRLTCLRSGSIDQGEFKTGAWSAAAARPFFIQEGDFLVSRGNGSRALVGRGGLVGPVIRNLAFPDTLIRLRPKLDVMSAAFLRIAWDSAVVRRQIESAARTTAGIYKINQQDIEQLEIPCPITVEEQARVAAAVDNQLVAIERCESDIDTQLLRATRLRQSILKHAFEGKLVPQDPNDEPASVLLDRIRVEHEKDAPRAPKSRAKAKTARRAPRR